MGITDVTYHRYQQTQTGNYSNNGVKNQRQAEKINTDKMPEENQATEYVRKSKVDGFERTSKVETYDISKLSKGAQDYLSQLKEKYNMARIKKFDYIKGFAIILIVLGHALTYCYSLKDIYKIIYSFHVPLFFIISGYFFNSELNFKCFCKKKAKRLLLPYLFYSFLFLIPYYIFGNFSNQSLGTEINYSFCEKIMEILYGVGANNALKQNSPLWFLPALYTTEIIFYIIEKITMSLGISQRKKEILIFIFFIFSGVLINEYKPILFFGLSTALSLGIFFNIGMMLRGKKLKKESNISACIISLLVGIIVAYLNLKISYTDYRYGNYFLFIVSACLLSKAIFIICSYIKNNNFLETCGKKTMEIMIFHKLIILFFQIFVYGKIKRILIVPLITDITFSIISTITALYISLIIGKIINYFLEKMRKIYEKIT